MFQAIQAVIAIYKERLMAMPNAPDTSYGRAAFGVDGSVNRRFLMHLFHDFNIAIHFPKDKGLLRSQMTCKLAIGTGLGELYRNAVIVFGGDAVGVLLPCALRLDLSSTDRGFTTAFSRFRRFCY
jgi:hypothetical protein